MSQDDLTAKIVRQVEYYFGDINLSKDKFMQEEIQKDSGWIPLEILTKFNRLKDLSDDFTVIIAALKTSTSDLLEINEADKKVRRSKPLPENQSEFETTLKQNTIYAKGFPATITLDELIAFFENHGKVLQVFMRRFPLNKLFKGSVFVTFETADQMKAFLELPEVKYQDLALTKESQESYMTRKGPEIQKFKDAKLKKEQEKEDKIKQRTEAEEAYLKEKQVAGAVMFIKGINEEGTRENLKELFDNFAKVQWIDYSKGLPEAHVRFVEANTAKDALAKAIEAQADGDSLKLKGATLEVRVLEGDEEQEYWVQSIRKQAEGRNAKNDRKKGGRGGGRGGNRGNNGNRDNKREWGNRGGNDRKRRNDDNNENGGVKADNSECTKKQRTDESSAPTATA